MDMRNTVEILLPHQLEERFYEAEIYPNEPVLIMQDLTFAQNYGIMFNMPKNKKSLKFIEIEGAIKKKEFPTHYLYFFSKNRLKTYKFKEIKKGTISKPIEQIVSMIHPLNISKNIHKNDPLVLAWGPGILYALEGIPTIPTLEMKIYEQIINSILKNKL